MDILSDASKAWRALAVSPEASDEITILSPFITGPVLKELVQQSTASKLTIITALTAKSLHSGSIDLDVLEDLLKLGVDLRTYQPLHAKLMLRGNTMVMGSQNFTSGGMHNLEISIRTELGEEEHRRLKEIVNNALSKSSSVQGTLLQALKEEISKIEVDQVDLDDKYREINGLIYGISEKQPTALELAHLNAEKIFDSHQAANSHDVVIHRKGDDVSDLRRLNERKEFGFGPVFPLSDLTRFVMHSGDVIDLNRGNYYFGLDLNSLRPFYMKANKTQTTFFYYRRNYRDRKNGQQIQITLQDPKEAANSANIDVQCWLACDEESLKVELGCKSFISASAEYHASYLFDGTDLTLLDESVRCGCYNWDSKKYRAYSLEKALPADLEPPNKDELFRAIFSDFSASRRSSFYPHHIFEYEWLLSLGVCEARCPTNNEAYPYYIFKSQA